MSSINAKWQHDYHQSNGALSRSFDFLDGLARSGLTVAAYQPSSSMVEAGARVGNVSRSQAKAIYLAMITHKE